MVIIAIVLDGRRVSLRAHAPDMTALALGVVSIFISVKMSSTAGASLPVVHSQASYGSADSSEPQSQICIAESWERVRHTDSMLTRQAPNSVTQRASSNKSSHTCPAKLHNLCAPIQERCSLRRTLCNFTVRNCNSKIYYQYFFKSKSIVIVLLLNVLYSTAIYGVTSEVLKVILGTEYVLTRLLLLHGITQVLFPITGHVADTYVGRHNVLRFSLWVAWIGFAILAMTFSFAGFDSEISVANRIIVLPISFVFLSVSYVCFVSNIIPFGLDQLQGASHIHYSSLFYWWYWTSNIGVTLVNLPQFCKDMQNRSILMQAVIGSVCVSVAIAIDILFKHWYVIEPTSKQGNPLRQIVTILRHTLKSSPHKGQRVPSTVRHELNLVKLGRLDFSKKRYGGVFETEQVEDVKTFFRMLLVLFSVGFPVYSYAGVLGSVGLMEDHMIGTLPHLHLSSPVCGVEVALTEVISSLLLLVLIPIIDLLVVPLLRHFTLNPSILKRLCMGASLGFVSLLFFFSVETFGKHIPGKEESCMFSAQTQPPATLDVSVYWLFLPLVLVTLAEILIYIPSFEFICAQSPYNMRGLLIGIFFSIQGLFSLLSLLLQYIFSQHKVYSYPFHKRTGLFCAFWYYLVFVCVSFFGLVFFCAVACKYKRRKREDVFNEMNMIEEYFSSVNVTVK